MSTNTTREASEWVVPGPPGAIVEKEGPRNGAASRRFVPGEGDVPGGDADCGDGRVAQGFRPAGVPRPGERNNRGDGPAGDADYGMAAEERGGTGPGDDGGAERRGGQKPQGQGPALHKTGVAAVGENDGGDNDNGDAAQAAQAAELGPNNERLHELQPRVVAALRDLMLEFRAEGLVARRHEIRHSKQTRRCCQGFQYAWWNPNDMSWHLPFDSQMTDDQSAQEMPRYQFVTNLYQAFGLSFVALLSQDTPTTRFYPQSAQNEVDVAAAKAASDVADLIEQNNKVQQLLTGVGYYLWTDGKIGGYVRFVADGQRFGWHNEDLIEEATVKLGEDFYACPGCGAAVYADGTHTNDDGCAGGAEDSGGGVAQVLGPAGFPRRGNDPNARNDFHSDARTGAADYDARSEERGGQKPQVQGPALHKPRNRGGAEEIRGYNGKGAAANFLAGIAPQCPQCGGGLAEDDFRPAEVVTIPRVVGVRRVPNGQEVISILGGLELNTPVWANEMHEFPYLQWQQEVHMAKLRAAYPHVADKIILGGPIEAEDVYARASRVAVAQGLPTTQPSDALYNLVTFTRTWIRPWAFYASEDAQTRAELLALFPEGCYVAFAGETYCESRNETLDDHWRVMHALPGDGPHRPSGGDSLLQIQEPYNTLSNIRAETYEFGIPPIYADPQVLDFDALGSQTAEPAAHYPARARPGQPLAASFYQPAPAQVPADMLEHQQDLAGPISQFLTGLFPAVFGGAQQGNKTAAGYAMARDQALGRLGLVWRRLKQFYADMMLLGVDTFRKNRPDDVEIPLLGASGEFESKWIRLADLKGNIQAHPEADETFPRRKSQQRAVLQQLMASSDPMIAEALGDPANIEFIKGVFGLSELVVPGEDAREKQLREISQLLASAPIVIEVGRAAEIGGAGQMAAHYVELPSVPVDELLDDHAAELAEIRRWASSDAGQLARMQNPQGFANVRAHALAHQAALGRQGAR